MAAEQQQPRGAAPPLPPPPPPPPAAVSGEGSWESRRFEVAGLSIDIRQDLKGSGALRPLDDDRVWGGEGGEEVGAPILTAEDLSRVGLVAWQAGFVLADLLLRRPPFGAWHGTRVLDLGCGTGLVGLLLALAGAEVTLSDQPHIMPLVEANARANLTPGMHRWRLAPYVWGQGDAAAALLPPCPLAAAAAAASSGGGGGGTGEAAPQPTSQPPPPPAPSYDVITAADVVYQPEQYGALASTLRAAAAPHTLLFVAFKRRGLHEERFLSLLEGAGFALQDVPAAQLAEEYREGGTYRVVRACRIE